MKPDAGKTQASKEFSRAKQTHFSFITAVHTLTPWGALLATTLEVGEQIPYANPLGGASRNHPVSGRVDSSLELCIK